MKIIEDIRPDQEFLAFLAQGKFMLQQSRSSGKPFFYPRVAEPRTGKTDLEWIEASGGGTVYATTLVRVRPPNADYGVIIVELDEGPRMLSRVEDVGPAELFIGMRVQAKIVPFEDQHCVVFVPAASENSGKDS
ncbi:MAG: OB-fold domain-containing protein [Betaproteobacteria bacterium]|nr:OB-fold domain-containing protein [Betaproteobacteria bacterium]